MNQNINQIIRERRSHYPQEYTGQMLDNEIITTLLENANWAPNHTLNYPWRFKVLKRNALSEWLDEAIKLYKTETSPEKFNQKKIDKMEMYRSKISHAIVIVKQNNPEIKSSEREDVCAIACGVQNMYLSMSQYEHAAGYWSTGLGTNSSSMHHYFQLTDSQQILGYFIVGHVIKKRTESNRKNIREFILS